MAGTVAIQQPATTESQASSAVPGGAATFQQQAKSALYVGELDPSVNEGQLFEIFNQIGPVHSIRVCRDVVTRRSLGYAYVNYNANADPEAAGRAIEQLNYIKINGKPLRIMWSDRDPSQRRSGQGNVFIKNLDPSIDHKALHDTFAQFGKILSCKIATDEKGQTKGYGFVHFESAESAKDAIAKVNGKKLRNTLVYVGPFVKRQDRIQQHEKEFTNLYVKNLAEDVDNEGLKEMFAKYGEISSAIVMKDDSGTSKKFGFVDFKMPDAAKNAINELHESDTGRVGPDGQPLRLYVARAQKKSERQLLLRQHYEGLRQQRIQQYSGLNVYVRNLAEEVDDEALRGEFSQFGNITSAKVMRDDSNVSRGFGFVCFSSQEEATRAINEKQNQMFHGKPLFVTLAQPKEVRRMQNEQLQGGMIQGRAPAGGPPAMGPTFIPPGVMYPGPMQAPGQGVFFTPHGMPRPGSMGRGRGGRMQPGYGRGMPQGMMPPYQQPGMGPQRMGQPRPRGRGPFPPGRTPQRGQYPGAYGAGATYYPARGRGSEQFRGRGRPGGRGGGRDGPPSRQVTPPGGQAPPPAVAMAAGPPGMAPGGGQVVETMRSDALDPKQLANLPPEEQKQMIGEKLFENIDGMLHKPNITGKVTGMLLEMDTNELLVLYDNPPYLKQKVDEALYVLKEAGMDPETGMETQEAAAQ